MERYNGQWIHAILGVGLLANVLALNGVDDEAMSKALVSCEVTKHINELPNAGIPIPLSVDLMNSDLHACVVTLQKTTRHNISRIDILNNASLVRPKDVVSQLDGMHINNVERHSAYKQRISEIQPDDIESALAAVTQVIVGILNNHGHHIRTSFARVQMLVFLPTVASFQFNVHRYFCNIECVLTRG